MDKPRITTNQLTRANTQEQTWVAIRGGVYDITEFLPRHPGGKDFLLISAGKDITSLFESYHGSKHYSVLQKYKIGTLTEDNSLCFPPPDEFSTTVRRRVNEFFAASKLDRKDARTSYIHHSITVLLLFGLYWYQWSLSNSSWYIFYLVSVLYGFVQAHYCVSAIHDASHGAIGHNPLIWKLVYSGQDLINGCSSLLWYVDPQLELCLQSILTLGRMYQHVMSHHIFTNIDGLDTDIAEPDGSYRRIKSSQKYNLLYIAQFIYAPMLYVLLGTTTRMADIYNLLTKKRGHLRVNPLTWEQCTLFWGGKLFFFGTRFILPYIRGAPLSRVVSCFLVSDFVFSFFLAIIFQASHVVEDVLWPEISPTSHTVNLDWGRLQVETAQDYAHHQPLTTFFTGGLNYQVVHHLFPNVAQKHLGLLAPIVRRVAQDYGVKYAIKESLWDAIGGHIGLLKLMGTHPHGLEG
ncbi:hypothetical protein FSARC_4456 [Fusarium sarcochroum]|uniref:Delta 8-(E)-sphingolipid desaturase n=1 Tax=Fusarium sarcochroum TaxID=1208366 RepID=A0A8H4U248_9HYPO|nr:hypothetical protein FSARC_4456 [Fusarium sarcochroum]